MSCSLACMTGQMHNTMGIDGAAAYPIVEFGDLDGNRLWLLMTLELEQADLLFNELTKQEREQLFVVTSLGEVLAEALPN